MHIQPEVEVAHESGQIMENTARKCTYILFVECKREKSEIGEHFRELHIRSELECKRRSN